jgi:metal-sulfur cluster biosynthetic enzyme
MPTHEQVMETLRQCYDPEIPLNIVDLGLIYDVAVEDDVVNVKMTLTARGCPLHMMISDAVRQQLEHVPGVREAHVELVWEPPWHPGRISEEGRRVLGLV